MYKMNLRLGKFIVFLFSLMLIIGIVYTISYYSYTKQFIINIYAIKEEKKDQDKSKGEEKDEDKDKDKDKEKEENIQKQTLENKTNAVKEEKKDQDKSKGEEKDEDKSKGEEKEVKE